MKFTLIPGANKTMNIPSALKRSGLDDQVSYRRHALMAAKDARTFMVRVEEKPQPIKQR
tara:strand:- start:10535 stop:10711 length:177 start_codon:yes stop_codon:yes gene_type:complete